MSFSENRFPLFRDMHRVAHVLSENRFPLFRDMRRVAHVLSENRFPLFRDMRSYCVPVRLMASLAALMTSGGIP
jgi:hypothetical protein